LAATAWTGILLRTPYKKTPISGFKTNSYSDTITIPFGATLLVLLFGALAHLTEASFLSSRYGHYIQLFPVRQLRQLLDFLGELKQARNNYTPEFKAKVVLEILSEVETVNQIAAKYAISPVVISRWKKEFLERASEVFKKGPSEAEKELEISKEHIAELERKVGQLTYEVGWLEKKSTQILGPDWKKKMR
jgi:putative transposase